MWGPGDVGKKRRSDTKENNGYRAENVSGDFCLSPGQMPKLATGAQQDGEGEEAE